MSSLKYDNDSGMWSTFANIGGCIIELISDTCEGLCNLISSLFNKE